MVLDKSGVDLIHHDCLGTVPRILDTLDGCEDESTQTQSHESRSLNDRDEKKSLEAFKVDMKSRLGGSPIEFQENSPQSTVLQLPKIPSSETLNTNSDSIRYRSRFVPCLLQKSSNSSERYDQVRSSLASPSFTSSSLSEIHCCSRDLGAEIKTGSKLMACSDDVYAEESVPQNNNVSQDRGQVTGKIQDRSNGKNQCQGRIGDKDEVISKKSIHSSPISCVSISRCVRMFALTACLLSCVGYSESRALTEGEKRYRQLQANTVKYLAQFGYLKGPSRETQDLRSQEDLTRAIKALQKAGGIPQTGVPDHRTEALMLKKRCGNTDDFVDEAKSYKDTSFEGSSLRLRRKKRYTVATTKWDRTNLTFRFVNYTPDMPQATTRRLISDALRVWSDATPLSFTEVRDSTADIMIMFASQYHSDGYPFDGKGMVLGHAFFPGPGKGGDTHFDDDENWTTNTTDGVDLFMVAAHELGHALGLAHSGDPGALMYPWYMGFEGKFTLPEDDYRGITYHYGTGEQDRRFPDKGKVVLIDERGPTHREPTYDVQPTKPAREEEDNSVGPADPCKSHIDALTVIRTEIFLFIGKYFWRLDSRKLITKPIEIHQFWYGLPKNLEKIDAVFERQDNKFVFFSGDRYWVFNANHLIGGFPSEGRPVTEFNIPADVKKIDAAFVWGYNKRTYLVSGDMYWKMNENNTFVEYDYPRDMGTWKGVPVPLDAAFKDWSGKTYFFQNLDYWEFYDMRMKVRRGYPKRISQHWLNCPEDAQRVEQREKPQSVSSNSNARLAADDSKATKTKHNNGVSSKTYSTIVVMTALLVYKMNVEILRK